MKTLLWNLGIAIIRIGYIVRNNDFKPSRFSLRWHLGVLILKVGYLVRGNIPQRTWKNNHV